MYHLYAVSVVIWNIFQNFLFGTHLWLVFYAQMDIGLINLQYMFYGQWINY